MKKLSVLVPVYNVEKYVKRCVDSLKNQTYKNLEIIFVEDKSIDNSLEILKQETKDMQNATIIEHETNKGLFMARFTGLQKCTGDYIAFLDSDDYLDENFCEVYMNTILKEDAEVCLCEHKNIDDDNGVYATPLYFDNPIKLENIDECHKFMFSFDVAKYGFITLWSKIIKRDLYDNVKDEILKLLPEVQNLVLGEDHLYTLILCSRATKIVSGKGAYYNYYRHKEQSVTVTSREKFIYNLDKILKTNLIARNYAKNQGLYDEYINYENWWLKNILSENFKLAFRYNCIKEYNEIINKYKVKEALTLINEKLKA